MTERESGTGRSTTLAPTESTRAFRERAREQARLMAVEDSQRLGALSPDARGLLNELRVRQIELELQNAELLRTRGESEAARGRYFDLYDLAPVGYLTIDDKDLVLEANHTAAGLLGVTRSTLVNQPWTRFIFPDDQETHLEYRRLLSSGASRMCELRLLRGGEAFWSLLEARVARGARGAPVCRTVLSDISDRKRSEAALRESEARHRVLFENSHDALMTVSPPEWRFTSGNAAALALLSAPSHACFLTQSPWDYSPERQPDGRFSKEKATAMIAAAMSRGSHSFRWRYRRPSGHEFSASVVLVRMRVNGVSLLQATVRDESEAQRQEVLLAQTERLASMGMLAASLGHEINNPLGYVLSNLEILAKNLPVAAAAAERCRPALRSALGDAAFTAIVGDDVALLAAETLRDACDRVRDALDGAQRIKHISKVLNEFSRVDALEMSRVDIEHAIQSAISLASNGLGLSSTLITEFGHVPQVWASNSKLAQVFLNLFSNASHAMLGGQPKDRRISVRTWALEGSVFAEVKDTGAGIAAADIGHIFDPFFSTKALGRGSGLGLAVCRNILVEFGGSIRVESEIGKGSRFVLQLPALPAAALPGQRAQPIAESAHVAASPARILVVDDEPMLCVVIKRLLAGHDVVTCSSGKAAQALLEHDQSFDLILCDLMMPDVTGMDLHRWLRTQNPTLASHLIFVTGGLFGPVAQEYLVHSGVWKIDKPFDNDTFVRIVSERLSAAKNEPPPGADYGSAMPLGNV